jgi:phage gpG-like protein
MASGLSSTGFESLEAIMVRAIERGQNLQPVWIDFGEQMILQTQIRAAAGIAPDGSPWPASARAAGMRSGQTMQRTGKLISGVTYEYDGAEFALYSNEIYAAVHQDGKTIYPKAGHKALAIPMSDAIANSYQAGVSIRDQYPGSFLFVSALGNAFIARRPEGGGDLEFLFQLRSSVTEPKRTFIGYSEADITYFEGRVVQHYGMFEAGGSA